MTFLRLTQHRILTINTDRKPVHFTFNGRAFTGLEGDTVASALLANGIRMLRVHEESGQPRGIYCNIGHCFECRVRINQQEGMRACLTPIQEGMNIQTGQKLPLPFKSHVNEQDFRHWFGTGEPS